jgi:H+/Cl- antiporter ClcA
MAATPAGRLLRQLGPALAVGVGSALVLLVVDFLSEHWLHDFLWKTMPSRLGTAPDSRWWIFAVLTAAGVAVGLIVWLMPGHAGPDPATIGLLHPPGPLVEVPGLLLAAIVGLAAGVSLGPEFPIVGANTAIAVAIGARFIPRVASSGWAGLATAGTLGALFGTPIAAALMITESLAAVHSEESLWDRLFAPLAAAAAGGLTALAISPGNTLNVGLPAYRGFHPIDLLSGAVIAAAATLVGLGATWLFPRIYALFHALRHPMLILTAGGVVLGLLGALGGPITLFKGLEQMRDLAADPHGAGWLAGVAAIKLAALLVAATVGFRGGRVFPAIFIAVVLGYLVNAIVPGIPVSLAVATCILGFILAITRYGWLSIFMAAVIVPDPTIVVIITIAVLPAWLLVTGRREMIAPGAPG